MEIGSLEQQMAMGRVDEILRMRAVLTPEQYKKLCAFREKKKGEVKAQHKNKHVENSHEGSEK